MSTFLPNKIRVLVVDGDAKFLKSSSMVLSVLNYKVTTCGCPISALKVLTKNKLDAVLTNSVDAVACGFDFRKIVESNLGIPVLYFLPVPHKTSVEEVDRLLRRLPPATYAVREPPRIHDMRLLRGVIAWRKCCLEAKLKQPAGNRTPTAIFEDLTASGGSTVDDEEREDEEERVQSSKVVKARGRGRKRKTGSNPSGSSGASSLAGDQPGQGQQQMNVTKGQERDNMAINQQQLAPPQQERRGTRAKKNKGKGKAPQFQEPQAGDGRQPGQQQQMSLLLQSLLHSLDVPPYNPSMFADAAGPSNNVVAACAGASNTAAPPPALPPPPPVYPGPAPAPRPVYSAPAPMPPLPPVNRPVLVPAPAPRPVMNSAPAPVPPVYPFPAPALPLAHQSLQPPMVQQGMFVPWSYGSMRRRENGSIMLSFQQPPAGDFFTGIGSGGATFGASSAAAAPHAGANGNAAGALLQSLNLFDADDRGELPAMATMYPEYKYNPPMAPPQHAGAASNDEAALAALYSNNYCARSLMAPQHIGRGAAAANEAAGVDEALSSDGYINYNTVSSFMAEPQQVGYGVALAPGEAPTMEEILDSISFSSGSPLAPDQVLGMASDVNDEQTIAAGGAIASGNAASFTPFQDLVVEAPNGNDQLAPGALDGDLNGSLVGSQGLGHGAAVDGGDAGFAAMFPADDQYEENTMFSLEELLGCLNDSPMCEAGLQLDGQQGGATGGAAAAAGAAGTTSLIGGAGGKGTWGDIGAAGNSDILDDDFILDDLWT